MRNLYYYAIIFPFIIVAPVTATVIHIPGDYPSIQSGIDAAVDGDTILVASGEYGEHIDFNGKDVELRSEEGPETTVIEPASGGIPLVRFAGGETSSAILDGFTIRIAENASAIEITGSSPTIINNIISNCNRSGLIAEGGAFPEIRNNVFIANDAPGGGGVYCTEADIILDGNEFLGNTVTNNGGGVYLWQSNQSIIHHNIFSQNYAHSYGGGLCLNQCSGIEVYNNTVAFNSTDQQLHGGGISVYYSQNCLIYNNIVSENMGEGIFQSGYTTSDAAYNDVWNNDDDYYGIEPGEGSISQDPLFEGGVPYSYYLMPDSPCIDSGDPDSPADPDGSTADMGALPYDHGPGKIFDIAEITGFEGQPVTVPIVASGFDDTEISGLEFHIIYDHSELQFESAESGHLNDILFNDDGENINIVWDDILNPVIFPDSSIVVELQFSVIGVIGDTCDISWQDNNELVDPSGEVIDRIGFFDGNVAIEEISGVGHDDALPEGYYIRRNYPNPFNGSTVFEFAAAQDSRVIIEIFDITGRRVGLPVDKVYRAGEYKSSWESGIFPSGIYLYQITVGGYVRSGKMTLLK